MFAALLLFTPGAAGAGSPEPRVEMLLLPEGTRESPGLISEQTIALKGTGYAISRGLLYVGQPIPENARLVRDDNEALILTGMVVGGVPYLVSFLIAMPWGIILAATGDSRWLPLAIPVVGPYISLSLVRDGPFRQNQLLFHGINAGLQTLGAALFVFGKLTRSAVGVRHAHPGLARPGVVRRRGRGGAAAPALTTGP